MGADNGNDGRGAQQTGTEGNRNGQKKPNPENWHLAMG